MSHKDVSAAPDARSEEAGSSAPAILPRRDFIALSGLALTAAALDALPLNATAGPFDATDFERLIPADKKLRPEWVRSLNERGGPTLYTKKRDELRHIGMPVGGICCGTLYLGGDGRLWLWDIFNANQNGILPRSVAFSGYGDERSVDTQNGANYVSPAVPASPLAQGFALRVNGQTRPLDASGWADITFQGEYPLGMVTYTDPACPVKAHLTAYSPFIPLNADDSGLPATLCEFTFTNTSDKAVTLEVGGWLQNGASLFSARLGDGQRVNAIQSSGRATLLSSRFERTPPKTRNVARPDVPVDDWERADWGGWKVEGTAFGTGPVARKDVPAYQGDLGGDGGRVVNSHAAAPGTNSVSRDNNIGLLTGPTFAIERDCIAFWIGGGANIEEVGLRLVVDGKTVRRAAGQDNNRMRYDTFDVRGLAGKQAHLEIYDRGTGAWGHIGVGKIVQTDTPRNMVALEQARDWGSMALALLEGGTGKANIATVTVAGAQNTGPIVDADTSRANAANPTRDMADAMFAGAKNDSASRIADQKLVGAITKSLTLAPGKSQTVTFVVAWHFANSGLPVPDAPSGNYYAQRFADAPAVAAYIARERKRLSRDTKLWHATWYDSTLPHWFLDRTFVNTSILATSTAHRFGTGRFWGWEGVGCCEGTCTHVWHYAQAMGRVFPELERIVRERVDFGAAFDATTGMIRYRGENTGPAVDGQCGRILGVLREHQMSADDGFLRRIWPNVRGAMQFMIRHDSNGDGLLDGAQENTLDAAWWGKIAWLSSLYAAALKACEIMAGEVGDTGFARLCATRFEQSRRAIEGELYNGEYFIQRPAPGHEQDLGTYQTCHIDQVHGQSWAWQVGLERILDRDKTLSALEALYKYNFAPDVGPFRRKNRAGRPYAIAGDGGLIMAANPKEIPGAFGNVKDWQFGYFNECMSGFEHQAASHMIAEGQTLHGLAVTRAIHDRYHASRRNPYNEIECSDHYSRAMASYGSFVTACGFTYHGPRGHIGFAPRLSPDDFQAPFTSAEGWGTFRQKRADKTLTAGLLVRHGRLKLNTLALQGQYTKATARHNGKAIAAGVTMQDGHVLVTFTPGLVLESGKELTLTLA